MAKDVEEKIDDLARAVADGFGQMATKDDLAVLKHELVSGVNDLLLRHLGVFSEAFDSLANRVKKLEEAVFGASR